MKEQPRKFKLPEKPPSEQHKPSEHDPVVVALRKQVQELQAERTQLKIKLLHQQQIITKVFP